MANLETIIDGLKTLLKVDYDSVCCYNQASGELDEPGIHATILRFRDEHERHIDSLAAVIRNLGEEPPPTARDFKGVLMEGFTAVRAMMGIKATLKALRTNEKVLLRHYEQAVAWGSPADIEVMLDRHLADERAHMDYIQRALAGRIWEAAETGVK